MKMKIYHLKFASIQLNAGLNGCLNWPGALSNRYGSFSFQARHYPAHRVAWEIANKRKIPVGKVIRHTCDNPACCNPEHLLIGTQRDNLLDMSRRGRHVGSRKIQPSQAAFIRFLDSCGVRTFRLAKLYGVKESNIRAIRNKYSWAHVPDMVVPDNVRLPPGLVA